MTGFAVWTGATGSTIGAEPFCNDFGISNGACGNVLFIEPDIINSSLVSTYLFQCYFYP